MGRFSIVFLLCLTACATTPQQIRVCPQPKTYTAAQDKKVAVEIKALPAGSLIPQYLGDYHRLRTASLECAK